MSGTALTSDYPLQHAWWLQRHACIKFRSNLALKNLDKVLWCVDQVECQSKETVVIFLIILKLEAIQVVALCYLGFKDNLK